ncbi:MAG: hypothetical protein IJO60_00200 [Agathobacter sp.]|nr:hypothetical protein [Agathobacter sp.]
MKRFVTYLYAYVDGQKMKNTGHIRVDVRGCMLDMLVSIKDSEVDNTRGTFYILEKKETVSEVALGEISMQSGEYNGRMRCDYKEQEMSTFSLENIIGVAVRFENGCYMASCWKDGEEELIAGGRFSEGGTKQDITEQVAEVTVEEEEMADKCMMAAAVSEQKEEPVYEIEPVYRKINLSEIYSLPSPYWHFSNNSFLLHGFWNYGYLVVKEDMAENEKRIALGVPGIYEQPEMVMATYFGFTWFEELPSQAVEMEIGQSCPCERIQKNQPPQDGTFGCWFTDL